MTLRFAANLSLLFTETPFIERFWRARRAGFAGVECLFPYALPALAFRNALNAHDLTPALFNAPPGNWDAGERGLAAVAGREADFEAAMEQAFAYARVVRPGAVHVMAGAAGPEGRERYIANLKRACAAAPAGLTLTIEPINTRRDMPGYHLSTSEDALRVLDAVGAGNLRLQFDLYHAQIMEGDLLKRLEALTPVIGHIQIAGVPERHEPDSGEIRYETVFDALESLGYSGWIGCEYRPRGRTEDGLGWFAPWRRADGGKET